MPMEDNNNNNSNNSNAVGAYCYEIAKKLFPICRSITGNGFRQSLAILKEELPEINVFEVHQAQKSLIGLYLKSGTVLKLILKIKITTGSSTLKITICMF